MIQSWCVSSSLITSTHTVSTGVKEYERSMALFLQSTGAMVTLIFLGGMKLFFIKCALKNKDVVQKIRAKV